MVKRKIVEVTKMIVIRNKARLSSVTDTFIVTKSVFFLCLRTVKIRYTALYISSPK